MGAVQGVPRLKCDHLGLADLFEQVAYLGGRAPEFGEVVVPGEVEHAKGPAEIRSSPGGHLSHERVTRIGRAAYRQGFELRDRKSTRLNSSHHSTSYAVFCLKKKK